MTQQIRDLLDAAVSGLEPQTVDPVGAVVRRGRAERFRTVGAVAAVAVVLVGGVAVGGFDPVHHESHRPARPAQNRQGCRICPLGRLPGALVKAYRAWPKLYPAGDPEGYTRRVMVRAAWRAGRRLWRREVLSA